MKNEIIIKRIMYLFFFIYFIILLAERTISIILSFINNINIFSNGFYIFAYLTTFISIIAFIIFLVYKYRLFIKLFNTKIEIEDNDFNILVIASGIILVSGMIHTEYTNLILQFVSYAFLIIAIILKSVTINTNNKLLLWVSTIYLLCYSMAIPVCYYAAIQYDILFYIIQGITMFGMVLLFTLLTLKLFNNKINLFNIVPIVFGLLLDIVVIALRFKDTINYFLIIFISLSVILYIIGIKIRTFNVKFIYNGEIFIMKEKIKYNTLIDEPLLKPTVNGHWDYDFSNPVKSDIEINWIE